MKTLTALILTLSLAGCAGNVLRKPPCTNGLEGCLLLKGRVVICPANPEQAVTLAAEPDVQVCQGGEWLPVEL